MKKGIKLLYCENRSRSEMVSIDKLIESEVKKSPLNRILCVEKVGHDNVFRLNENVVFNIFKNRKEVPFKDYRYVLVLPAVSEKIFKRGENGFEINSLSDFNNIKLRVYLLWQEELKKDEKFTVGFIDTAFRHMNKFKDFKMLPQIHTVPPIYNRGTVPMIGSHHSYFFDKTLFVAEPCPDTIPDDLN